MVGVEENEQEGKPPKERNRRKEKRKEELSSSANIETEEEREKTGRPPRMGMRSLFTWEQKRKRDTPGPSRKDKAGTDRCHGPAGTPYPKGCFSVPEHGGADPKGATGRIDKNLFWVWRRGSWPHGDLLESPCKGLLPARRLDGLTLRPF